MLGLPSFHAMWALRGWGASFGGGGVGMRWDEGEGKGRGGYDTAFMDLVLVSSRVDVVE